MYKISYEPEEIEKLPLGSFPGEIIVINKPGPEYLRALAYLFRQKILGFDTETRPVFTSSAPHCKVALLQLSGPDKAYLFRLNKMGMRKGLCAILSNPRIKKIGAASDDDVRGLRKRMDFKAAGFVDLQAIAWQWGIRDKSVKKLAANILGVKISKTQQLSNWEADELSESQRKYAATDAWVCVEMYKKLLASEKHPLTPQEQIPPQQLAQQLEAQQRKKERQEAMEAERKTTVKRHRKRHKKKKTDDKGSTEEKA